MDCKKAKNLIPFHLYGELNEKDKLVLEEHLQTCRTCLEEFQATKKVFQLLDEYRPAQAPEPDWEKSWQKIQAGFGRERSKRQEHLSRRWRWAVAGSAMATVLILGILIGKYWFLPSPQPLPSPSSKSISAANLQPILTSHLEDLKPLLLEYAHYSPRDQGAKTIAIDEKIVRGLLLQNMLLKRMLAEKDPAAAELLDDLDLVLKEIANRPSQDQQAPSEIKDLIDRRGILFKMEILKTL